MVEGVEISLNSEFFEVAVLMPILFFKYIGA